MKVTKVSSRSVRIPDEAPAGVVANPLPETALQESAFFAAQVRGLGPLRLGKAQAKLKLRQKVESNLQDTFKVASLIDGLTDFLSEVVGEDPRRARLLGV